MSEEYVLRNNAYVKDMRQLVNITEKYDLHSSDMAIKEFVVFVVRKDWPVEKILKTVLRQIFEGRARRELYGNFYHI